MRDGGIAAVAALSEVLRTALAGLPPDAQRALKQSFGKAMEGVMVEIIGPAVSAYPELVPDEATWCAALRAEARKFPLAPELETPGQPAQRPM